jgi:ribosomal protein S27AE
MSDPPNSPGEPRAGGRPAFIDPACKVCGTALVLHDSLRKRPSPPGETWHDEWECPKCRDGLHLDVPKHGTKRWADIKRQRPPGSPEPAPLPEYRPRTEAELAADPRTQRRPVNIAPACPRCGAGLVLLDLLFDPVPQDQAVDQTEFTCPRCLDGIYPDEPKEP